MIKLISILYLSLTLCSNPGIHSYTVPLIEGGSQPMAAYAGKRLLIVTLPVVQTPAADSLLYSLDTLAAAHIQTHQVLAVPSYEDGFTAGGRTALQQWYRAKLGSYIVVTDGLYTRKTSGSQQHGLFQWLTQVSNNQLFDKDVEGPWQQFFVFPDGKLYGMLHAPFAVSSSTVYKVLTIAQEQGE